MNRGIAFPLLLGMVLLATGERASAQVSIGPFTFGDRAFADGVGAVQGSWVLDDGATSVANALVGPLTDGRTWSYGTGSFVEVLFIDNVVRNGAGDDLAVFETGVLDLIAVEINGTAVVRDSVFTGVVTPTRGYDVNAATFDLSDFGVAPGASVSSLRILGGYERRGTVSAYSVIGALSERCYPDCDGSGEINVFDFLCFQDAFVRMDPYADCDGNSVFDVFDFLCFQDAFLTGCP